MENNVIAYWINGKWDSSIGCIPPRSPQSFNFLIVCRFGDWSGFRSLAECKEQNPDPKNKRPDLFFWIEER